MSKAMESDIGPETMVDDLGALLVRAAQGDCAAFERIYDQSAGAVLGHAASVLRNRSIAEEVTLDVMVEVWRRASAYSPERGSGRTWVMTIAHRRAVDRVRHEQSAAERSTRVATREVDRPHDRVSEQVESNLDAEQVRELINQLSDVQREALCLAYFDGHTYPEVAQLVGAPLGTIKTRVRDSIHRLRVGMTEMRD